MVVCSYKVAMMHEIPLLRADAGKSLALVDDQGVRCSHAELIEYAAQWKERLAGPRGLVTLFVRNTVDDVAALFGAWAAGHVVALFNPDLSRDARCALRKTFEAEWSITDGVAMGHGRANGDLHPDLFLLLSTSGSTGSAKLVRLSQNAVTSNAQAITNAMELQPDEIASGHLPLHYSYGLSVLTSHLMQGAAVRLTEHSFMSREFWASFTDDGITHLPGVPYHYQMLERLRMERLKMPALRLMSQAGGSLAVEARERVHAFMDARNGRFLVMYGQTEAAPRMSTLAHGEFHEAPGSVGRALENGRFEIENGEVVYHGPNVMMGYAQERADLSEGDKLGGLLRTGDCGELDLQQRLTLTGRTKRMGKVFGVRVDLDELEERANEIAPAAIIQVGDHLHVHFASDGDHDAVSIEMKAHLARHSTLPQVCWRFVPRDAIPHTGRGKIDYAALEVER